MKMCYAVTKLGLTVWPWPWFGLNSLKYKIPILYQ